MKNSSSLRRLKPSKSSTTRKTSFRSLSPMTQLMRHANKSMSRRSSRHGFKSGALNCAAKLIHGEYVLLLDADSIVTSQVLTRGLISFEDEPDLGFVSYRVGHYNREQNLITRLFALSIDLGDTL